MIPGMRSHLDDVHTKMTFSASPNAVTLYCGAKMRHQYNVHKGKTIFQNTAHNTAETWGARNTIRVSSQIQK